MNRVLRYVGIPNDVAYDMHAHKTMYCIDCNAVVPMSRQGMHNDYHDSYTNRKDGNMSSVLWCDRGDHAFKAGSPGAVHFQGTETDEHGVEHTTNVDACVKHNPFRADPTHIAKELLTEYPTGENVD